MSLKRSFDSLLAILYEFRKLWWILGFLNLEGLGNLASGGFY